LIKEKIALESKLCFYVTQFFRNTNDCLMYLSLPFHN